MGVTIKAIQYPPTEVHQDGPRGLWYRYVMAVPSGTVVSGLVSSNAFCGPVDFPGEGGAAQLLVRVSQAGGWAAAATWLTESNISVLGSNDEPSTTPTNRNWQYMRGDVGTGATGVNMLLYRVTAVGQYNVVTPARSYLVAIQSATSITGAIRVEMTTIKANG